VSWVVAFAHGSAGTTELCREGSANGTPQHATPGDRRYFPYNVSLKASDQLALFATLRWLSATRRDVPPTRNEVVAVTTKRSVPTVDIISPVATVGLSNNGKALARGNMPDAVAGVVREAILDGTLEPGTWLREADVAGDLRVSRTPVRDAFRILASEGLVEIKANQGAIVSPMNSDDILELYIMRESLEGLASRLAALRDPRGCLERFSKLIPLMKTAGEAGEYRELSRLYIVFHGIVRDAAGNRYLERSLTQVQNAARRFPDPTLGLPGRVEESLAEHLRLADAISKGDAVAAEQLAIEHMRHLSEVRIRMLLGG